MYRIWTARSLLPESMKWAVTVVIGGSTFTCTLFYKYIVPNMFEYSSILLPFAISNGKVISCWICSATMKDGVNKNRVGSRLLSFGEQNRCSVYGLARPGRDCAGLGNAGHTILCTVSETAPLPTTERDP